MTESVYNIDWNNYDIDYAYECDDGERLILFLDTLR